MKNLIYTARPPVSLGLFPQVSVLRSLLESYMKFCIPLSPGASFPLEGVSIAKAMWYERL